MLVAPRIVNDVSYVTDINHENHFSWQAQHLVILECHFLWQAQYSVKFEEIAGARNVVIFNTKCVSEARKVTSANGRVRDDEFMVGSCSDHVRIMLGSWSNRPRIGIDASTVLGEFRLDFGVHFCVAGAVFAEVGG